MGALLRRLYSHPLLLAALVAVQVGGMAGCGRSSLAFGRRADDPLPDGGTVVDPPQPDAGPGSGDDSGDGPAEDGGPVDPDAGNPPPPPPIDRDGDGVPSVDSGGTDCNDDDPTVFPDAEEAERWHAERVDDGGEHVSLAFTSDGTPHLVYFDLEREGLFHAALQEGVWTMETIDAAGNPGNATSIGVDAADVLHVAYHDREEGALRYATNAPGAWETETIDDRGTSGVFSSLVRDGDAVAIAYHDNSAGELRYSNGTQLDWRVDTVDDHGFTGAFASLGLDGAGDAHVAYVDLLTGDLHHATNDRDVWRTETVLERESAGSALDVGRDDRVHVLFEDVTDDTFSHAWLDRGADEWTVESTGINAGMSWMPAMQVDDEDAMHAAFRGGREIYDPWTGDVARSGLLYANRGTSWGFERIDDGGGVSGRFVALALDPEGEVRVAYSVLQKDELRYGWRDPTDGVDQDCNGVP